MIKTKKSAATYLYSIAIVLPILSGSYFIHHVFGISPIRPLHEVELFTASFTQEFTLTSEQLKAFEGYFQYVNDPEGYLQFSVKGKGLIAKQVWDGKEFFILPKSPLEFASQVENYPVRFTKDEKEAVTQVLVFNKDVWKKVKSYSPKKNISLSSQELKAFAGKYSLHVPSGEEVFLEISAKEDHLMLKEMWSGNEIKFLPTSALEFYNREHRFPLKFTKDNNGVVTHVLAFKRDLWSKVGK